MSCNIQETESEIIPSTSLTLPDLERQLRNFRKVSIALRDNGLTDEERVQQRQRLTKRMMEGQIRQKERYKHIFRTTSGSTYFTLNTGESLRIKREEIKGRSEWNIQPILHNIFFTTESEADSISQILDGFDGEKRIIGIPIQTLLFSIL